MMYQAIVTAGGAFLASAVLWPLDRRYNAWKASRGELQLRRDRRGRLVPDLRLKRAETAAKVALILLFVAGAGYWCVVYSQAVSWRPYKPDPPLPAGYKVPDSLTPPPLYYQPKPAAPAAQ